MTDSGHGIIPKDSADDDFKLTDLEGKMTSKLIAEGKRLAKETKVRLLKKPRFFEGF